MENNILPNTMQIQDLPVEILVRIFIRLDYRDRIRLESVSTTWRAMALDTWKDQRILRFRREMLHLDEHSIVDKLNSQQNELVPLEAIIRRCAPFLDELHLLGAFAFDMKMRFDRIFSRLAHPHGRLAHLHITTQLDSWHLHTIQRHLAPQLISLAVVPTSEVLDNYGKTNAFKQLLASCNKLENLQIGAINHYYNLNGRIRKGSTRSLALTSSCCSFMPSTLKCLLIHQSHWWANPVIRVNTFLSLLAHCSQLRYMPILVNAIDNAPVLQLIEEKNVKEFDKIIRLQFPLFIAKSYSFPYIQRPEFRNLKALHLDFEIEAEKIHQIAKCCPQLEHLGIRLSYWGDNHSMEIQDLVALHQFQQLSSLKILIEFGYYNDFHKIFCPGGERADMTFLGILTELDQIHALRVIKKILKNTGKNPLFYITTQSLDFKALSGVWNNYPSLSQDYLLQMSNQLKHLETFSCSFYLRNLDIDVMTGIGQFCEQLREIFDSQAGSNKKSFKFRLLANDENKLDIYGRRERKNLLVEQKGCGTKRSKMNWHCMPLTGPKLDIHRNYDFQPARSIVLNELITNQFGQRTSSMLFDSFGMMEEEH